MIYLYKKGCRPRYLRTGDGGKEQKSLGAICSFILPKDRRKCKGKREKDCFLPGAVTLPYSLHAEQEGQRPRGKIKPKAI